MKIGITKWTAIKEGIVAVAAVGGLLLSMLNTYEAHEATNEAHRAADEARRAAEPVMYTSIALEGRPDTQGLPGEKRYVRMVLTVSNNGNNAFELPPRPDVTLMNSRRQSTNNYQLMAVDESGGPKYSSYLPRRLMPGEKQEFATPYYPFSEMVDAYDQFLVVINSQDGIFASLTPITREPDKLEKVMMQPLWQKYFGKLAITGVRALRQ